MGVGDIVRLKQPFRPDLNDLRTYDYGIIAGVVNEPTDAAILIRLYNLETATLYTDRFKSDAIFSFRLDEIDCCISL